METDNTFLNGHIFIHSFGMCRMGRFLVVLRSSFHSSLLCTFSCHPSPPTILPSSLTSSFHLFLGLPLNFVVPKFIYNTLLGILFSSILCTCPNQRNLFNLIEWSYMNLLKYLMTVVILHVSDVDSYIFINCNWVVTWWQYTFTHKQFIEQHK